MPTPRRFALATLVLALAACDRSPALETRTYTLDHLAADEAAQLVMPYVRQDRERAAGTVSFVRDAITVRETADNLDRIEQVLREFDVVKPDVRLHFQLIEADGFEGADPRIAALEQQLREMLQFDGYRLSGEASVTATDHAKFEQTLSGSGGVYQVTGQVHWVQGTTIRLQDVGLFAPRAGTVLSTTVNIRPGQTLVLGTSSRSATAATLLLTVTAEQP